MVANKVIHFFWEGALNETCLISLNSFLANNHECYLWSYTKTQVKGVISKDASDIVSKEIFRKWFPSEDNNDYRRTKLPTFACYFRYKLIYEVGGWWCDLDTICLRPFDFDDVYVFCGQYYDDPKIAERENGLRIICGTFKSPKGSKYLRGILDEIATPAEEGKNPGWGVWGPFMFTKYVVDYDLLEYKKEFNVFAPFPPGESGISKHYLEKNVEIPNWAYALHMFNRSSMDLIGKGGSLYDLLRSKYLPKTYNIL